MRIHIEEIQHGVETAGLSGKPVCLHSSLRSFGYVEGGAQAVINAFLSCGCTLLAPAFRYDTEIAPFTAPQRNGWEYATPSTLGPNHKAPHPADQEIGEGMGAIPSAILSMPERRRGLHPLNSFVAIGPLAIDLVEGQTAEDVYAPFRSLIAMDGRIALLGVGLTSMTAIHYAEQLAGRQLFIRWANGADGRPTEARVGSCSDGFDSFDAVLAPIERRVTVGESLWRIFDAEEAVARCAQAIRRDPSITACGDPACERCRDAVAGGPIPSENP